MLGYQEGYDNGYDDGYKQGVQEGLEKGYEKGKRWRLERLEFIKIKCACGCIIPYPIFVANLDTVFRVPDSEKRKCPNCHRYVSQVAFTEAYSKYRNDYR